MNTLTALTAEDKFMIELLVDGELDDPQRKELLIQLDRIEGGWRFCAIAFLESQCMRQVYKPARTCGARFVSPALSGHEVFGQSRSMGHAVDVDAVVNRSCVSLGSTALASDPEDTSLVDRLDCGRRSSSEPTIIPLKKGGYRPGRSFVSSGGSGGGTSWPAVLAAMAGGFLLAFVLTGLIAFLGSSATHTESSPVVPNSSGIPFARSESGSEPVQRVMDPQDDNTPIRLVTLKSPDKNLDGISVPCVDVATCSPDSLQGMRKHKATDHYVESLKKNGHKVESIYEELAFPLEDGRTLILPVDTFNVQYQTPGLQSYQ
ncbi:MAG: hypothetical protein PHQ75_02155 [Thermoguttaceae bacterium]|nr:hypothetical protein [Thermoguttaceae bacterium]